MIVSVQCELEKDHEGQHRTVAGKAVILWPILQSPTRLDRMIGLVLANQDWLVAMAGLDNSPNYPRSLRDDLLTLVKLAQKAD